MVEADTLRDTGVTAFAEKFIWVSIDVDREFSVCREYGVSSSPTFLLMNSEGKILMRLAGYFSPIELRKHLDEFLGSLNETRSAPINIENELRTPLTFTPSGYRGYGICFSNVGYGPLHLPSQSPFQSLRFGLVPRTPSTLGKGNLEIRETETWVNIFGSRGDKYLLDYEMLRSGLSAAYGLSDTLQVDAEIVDYERFGGGMDSFIQGFHRAFGIDEGGRTSVPSNDFSFRIKDASGQTVDLDGSNEGSFARKLQLTLQHNITCGTYNLPAVSYSLTIQTKLGSTEDIQNENPAHAGFSISLAKRFGEVYGYIGLGYSWFGNESFHTVELKDTQWSVLAVVEWRFSPHMSLLAQYLISEGVARNLGAFSDPSNEITLGWKYEFSMAAVLEIGLIENIITFDNSPDFGVHAGLMYRL